MSNPRLMLFYLYLVALGFGCSQIPKTMSITVAGLVFYNTSATPIHNATLRVSNTHGLVACGIILPGKECSTTFPQREYQGDPIIITWQQADRNWSTGEYHVQLPAQPMTRGPTIAVVTLGDHGTINIQFVPKASSQPTAVELQPQL